MPHELLLLVLEGPLQSWGLRDNWSIRNTELLPTKSGVFGLVGSAMGLERDSQDMINLHRDFRFGVGAQKCGTILEDFQTVSGYMPLVENGLEKAKENHVLQVLRQTECDKDRRHFLDRQDSKFKTKLLTKCYLQDASFLVILEPKSGKIDEDMIFALKHPAWSPFLGRKCCTPSRPIYEKIVETDMSLQEFLQSQNIAIYRYESSEGELSPEGVVSQSRQVFDYIRMNPH